MYLYSLVGPGSVDDLKAKGFSFLPNPIKNTVNLQADELISRIIIYDISGKKILSKTNKKSITRIDLTSLEKGNYFMQVFIGDTVGLVKILKE